MKKLLSYVVPFIKKIPSEINGTLEVTVIDGKKILDTAHANYSYGELQKILKYGLQQLDLSNVNSILLLGLGGGSVIKTLKDDFNYRGHITAVEIDPVIIDIAETEFEIRPTENLQIICADALEYVQQTRDQYDLIITDIFIDNKIPQELYELTFWKALSGLVAPSGAILLNTIERTAASLEPVKAFMKKAGFGLKEYGKVRGTNRLMVWRK